jgi:LmbE family N-acetylglucosaminyl deacetylase
MTGLPERLVVIAPHPDDETLGAGGSIARFAAQGVEVSVLVVSGHLPPLYPREAFETTHREAEAAFRTMGVSRYEFMEVPATLVHTTPVAE